MPARVLERRLLPVAALALGHLLLHLLQVLSNLGVDYGGDGLDQGLDVGDEERGADVERGSGVVHAGAAALGRFLLFSLWGALVGLVWGVGGGGGGRGVHWFLGVRTPFLGLTLRLPRLTALALLLLIVPLLLRRGTRLHRRRVGPLLLPFSRLLRLPLLLLLLNFPRLAMVAFPRSGGVLVLSVGVPLGGLLGPGLSRVARLRAAVAGPLRLWLHFGW